MRRSRDRNQKTADPGRITGTVSIRERPAEGEDRAVSGHCKGDLLFGGRASQIATLVERHIRYVLLTRVKRKDTGTLIKALIRLAYPLPRELCKALTWGTVTKWPTTSASRWHRHQRLFLRAPVSVATCLNRKHQRLATAILREGHGSLRHSSQRSRHRGTTT